MFDFNYCCYKISVINLIYYFTNGYLALVTFL